MVIKRNGCYKLFVHSSDPKTQFNVFKKKKKKKSFLHSFFLSSTINTTPPSLALSPYLLFILFFLYFSLSLSLFSFPLLGPILPSWIPSFSSLISIFRQWESFIGGLAVFDGMIGFGFDGNIVVEFWTLVGVIGLRSFGVSWVSL